MIYDLSLAFLNAGHEVVLYAAEQYKPTKDLEYPFEIIWDECKFPRIFSPHRFPVLKNLKRYIKTNKEELDLIISGEVFSYNSLVAYRSAKNKTIVWHELAKHNNMLKKIPSKIWYNFVARLFMKNALIVPRSVGAYDFIKSYCKNVSDTVIEHGVNLDKFKFSTEKTDSLVVCSQLIPRKRIDGIIENFAEYITEYKANTKLYIIGNGELEESLKQKAVECNCDKNVVFTGRLSHEELKDRLSSAKALLVNTEKDNSMISIVEAIACATPILTTDIPLNCSYIKEYDLGVVRSQWYAEDIKEIVENNEFYVKNCLNYREKLSTDFKVAQFIDLLNKM